MRMLITRAARHEVLAKMHNPSARLAVDNTSRARDNLDSPAIVSHHSIKAGNIISKAPSCLVKQSSNLFSNADSKVRRTETIQGLHGLCQ